MDWPADICKSTGNEFRVWFPQDGLVLCLGNAREEVGVVMGAVGKQDRLASDTCAIKQHWCSG